MSRVGNKPVPIPSGVTVKVEGKKVTATGPLGELSREIVPEIDARVEGNEVIVTRSGEEKRIKSLHGTMRSLIAGMIEGVHKGFTKELEIQGVGFRAQAQGRKLVMTLGFSHPIEYEVPEGINLNVPDATSISVSGADKQLVGQVGAQIRAFAPAEPYKGKGIRFKGEYVRRKAGKTVA